MKQSTLKRARELGFVISDKLSYYVSDYNLKLNEDTFEETEKWSTHKVYFYNVTFPVDYPNQHPQAVYDDGGLLALIKQYSNRFEDMRQDSEFSKQTIEAMGKFRGMFLQDEVKDNG